MYLNSLYILLHVVSAVIWVGGMFFAYMCLRPVAAQQLEPPQRLKLWIGVFSKFFPFVWLAVVLLPLTGYMMLFTSFGGFSGAKLYIHLMNGLGTVMILIYLHVFFAPFQRLKKAVATENWPEGGKHLNIIRKLVGLNLMLGLIVIVIASGGRFI